MSQSNYPSYYTPAAGPNGAAKAAMILGIIAVVLSPFAIGGLLGLVAMILGIVGVTKPGRKGMAIVGIVAGPLSMLIGFIALMFWAGFFFAVSARTAVRPRMAAAEISNLRTALEAFEIDNGRYPTQAEGLEALVIKPAGMVNWTRRYIDAVPMDPWGRPFVYRFPSAKPKADFDLFSKGPDGVEGTKDDVDSRP